MAPRAARPLEALVRHVRSRLARRQQPAAAQAFAEATPPSSPALDRVREFRQPDDTSCGASSLVLSRMLHDPAYGSWILDDPARWGPEVKAMHHRVSRWRDHDGRPQCPWPRVVGTSPWAAAGQMGGGSGRSGRGTRYRWRILDPDDLAAGFELIVAAARSGHTVPLYAGNAVRPAHVVLVVSAEPDRLRVYEPSAGRIVRVGREAFVSGALDLGGWSVPWFAVLPR
ncbi:hypothetical protein [Aeromicrobium sp.]|uniref:hypothetical protein n=1 Tax=Aeromicrobium sp. TaxID=1871063 RepID=UPI0028AA3BC1|nr:hypothetical protein [Aeromicrobium sp.]